MDPLKGRIDEAQRSAHTDRGYHMSEPTEQNKNEGTGPEDAGESSDEERPRKPRKRFEIDIFRAWCKSCGICEAFCPAHCIAFDEEGAPVVTDEDACMGCGWCEIHCPDFAISVRPRKPKIVQDED